MGAIATDGGWRLYVCGNGGMKPRHASLLASDLDQETLIRYIDRFLMFYIRTADRLQRTATWLDHLEVFNDSKRGIYKRLILEDDKVRGAVFYGDTSAGQWYAELMAAGRSIGPIRDKLLFESAYSESAPSER